MVACLAKRAGHRPLHKDSIATTTERHFLGGVTTGPPPTLSQPDCIESSGLVSWLLRELEPPGALLPILEPLARLEANRRTVRRESEE